jgi:hypothetical protein
MVDRSVCVSRRLPPPSRARPPAPPTTAQAAAQVPRLPAIALRALAADRAVPPGALTSILGNAVMNRGPGAQEIVEYARYIGMDPISDVNLLWIAGGGTLHCTQSAAAHDVTSSHSRVGCRGGSHCCAARGLDRAHRRQREQLLLQRLHRQQHVGTSPRRVLPFSIFEAQEDSS